MLPTIERAAAAGKPFAQRRLATQPDCDLDEPKTQLLWAAFTQLSEGRQIGFQACPITTSDIAAWMLIQGVSDLQERQELLVSIRVLDREYLALAERLAKRKARAKKRGS